MAASAVIGALRADLTLNSAQFTNGVRQAQGSMNNLRATMRALGAAAAALGTALGGIGTAAADNAQEILRLSRMTKTQPEEFQRWAAAARDVGIEQDLLGDILKDFNEKMGEYVSTGGGGMADFFEQVVPKLGKSADEVARQFAGLSGADGMQLYVDMLEEAGVGHKQMTFYLESAASDMSRLLPIMTNTGKGMEALADAAEKSGAIISTSALLELEKAGVAIDGMLIAFNGMVTEIGGAVAPAISSVAAALSEAFQQGGLVNTVFVTLAENIQRIGFYVGSAAVSFGAYQLAMAGAAVYTAGLSAALTFLRAALIRTGIGALIVGAGELAYQFSRLTEATGSIGAAWTMVENLLKAGVNAVVAGYVDVINGFISFIKNPIQTLRNGFNKLWASIPEDVKVFLGQALDVVVGWGQAVADFVKGVPAKMVEYFQVFPQMLRAIVITAANGLIAAVENMFNAVGGLVNKFVSGINSALASLPGWAGGDGALALTLVPTLSIPRIDNPDAAALKNSVQSALAPVSEAWAKVWDEEAGQFETPTVFEDVGSVSDEFGKITTALDGVGTAAEEALPPVSNLHNELFGLVPPEAEKGPSGAAGGLGKVAEAAEKAVNPMERLRDGLADVFASVVTGASSAKEALGGLLMELSKAVANKAFSSFFDSVVGDGGGFGTMLTSLGIGANANGTNNWRGGLTMVGERGPELVNLPRGSRVHTAQQTKGMLGGVLDIRLHVPEGVTAEQVTQIATGVSVSVVSQTAGAQRRGLNGSVNELNRRGV